MNHHLTRSACALFAILALLTAVLPAVRAEDRNLYVTGYTITSGGSISVARTSLDGAPLVYAVTLSGIKYKGTGQALRLQVGRAGEPDTNQSISTELKYSYDSGGMLTQATASDRINFSALVPSKADTPVPNIVIRSFTCGESSVAAGSSFPLRFAFENTGSIKIENIVVTVDGGENFTMDGGTNTFHYNALAAGAAQTQEVPNGKSGAQSIGVGFKYEYVDGDKRTSASADIRISVPIYQPDRFQLNAPVVPETANVGEETELTMAYVNKGKDDISNVEAIVEGDGVDTPARTQYLGNITAGTSGTIGFALTPTAAGPVDVVLKISYENADQQIQVKTFPVTLQAEDLPPPTTSATSCLPWKSRACPDCGSAWASRPQQALPPWW